MLKRVLSATFVVKSWEKIGRHGLSKETASVSISISQNASVFSFFGLLVALFTRSLLLSEVTWHVPSFWVECRLFPYFLLVGKSIVLFTFWPAFVCIIFTILQEDTIFCGLCFPSLFLELCFCNLPNFSFFCLLRLEIECFGITFSRVSTF